MPPLTEGGRNNELAVSWGKGGTSTCAAFIHPLIGGQTRNTFGDDRTQLWFHFLNRLVSPSSKARAPQLFPRLSHSTVSTGTEELVGEERVHFPRLCGVSASGMRALALLPLRLVRYEGLQPLSRMHAVKPQSRGTDSRVRSVTSLGVAFAQWWQGPQDRRRADDD
eukprot:4335371-Amphidinium_carterae.1